jgi:purine-nucleoside phosphorylase
MWEQVQETVGYINKINNFNPEYGVILGSGLGSFTEDINVEFISIMTYLTFLFLRCRVIKALWYLVLVIKGGGHARPFSFYEGYSMKSDFPVRVMKYLGITKLIVSNAGVNPYKNR